MFTTNLETALVSGKIKKNNKEDILVKEAEKLLKECTSSDIQLLKSLGVGHNLKAKEKLDSKNKRLEKFDKNRLFTRDEIKKLCITYGLRFLPFEMYKGEICSSLPGKIREFNEMSGEHPAMYNYGNNFKIAAPKESFELQERPVDPLLFYSVGDDHYYLIHKWGNDISALRFFEFLFKRSWKAQFAIIGVISFIGAFFGFSTFSDQVWPQIALLSLVSGIGIAFLLTTCPFWETDYSESKWDSPFRD